MSQLVDNHPLSRDFPELKEQIHSLKTGDAHFANLMTHYEALDKEIVRAEQGVEFKEDLELDGMKVKRLQMKDELYALLKTEAKVNS